MTGGSRGIGAAIAKLAGKQGYAVGVNYKSDARAASAVVADIEKSGGEAVALQGNMSVEADVDRVFKELDDKVGPLTHLVYNSGIVGKVARVDAVDATTLHDVFGVNVFGAFYSVRNAVPRISKLREGKGGAIVLISSMATVYGAPGEHVWYAASKGAIDAMTVGLSKELANDGIRVNAVAPGLIDTEMQMPGRLDRLVPSVPLQRAGKAEEVAQTTLFLLSDSASYMTGAIVRVSGGR